MHETVDIGAHGSQSPEPKGSQAPSQAACPEITTPEITTLTVEELDAAPHAVFRRHRAITPLVAHEGGGYLVLRADDVERLMIDQRLRSTETEFAVQRGITDGPLFEGFTYGMLTSNGAAHRRRRSPFTRTFAARMIAELRPRIRRVAEELIDSWEDEVDFVERFAALVPARVISALLGLPTADIPHFTNLVYCVSRIFSLSFKPDDLPDSQAAMQELDDYVEALLRDRRAAPKDDFLTRFVTDADQKGELSPIEIIIQIVIMIIGGTDTTRVAMAMQVALLLQHREQWDAVCRDPSLIPGAVTEGLRYEPSVAGIVRYALEDIELDGLVLPAGQIAMLSTMSAMRDDRVYEQPDSFNIRRTDQRRLHPVFGGGPHRCIGEALSKAELEEGLAALAARVPNLRLAGAMPKLSGHFGIRRIGAMPVTWRG